MPNERKHIRAQIEVADKENEYLTPQPLYLGKDETGKDRYTIVVFFPRLLWGKFQLATYHKKDLTLSKAEMLADSAKAVGEIDLYYWRPHY